MLELAESSLQLGEPARFRGPTGAGDLQLPVGRSQFARHRCLALAQGPLLARQRGRLLLQPSRIRIERATADVALGTGFLVEARGIYVLTNDHIAAAAPAIRVVLADRRELAARVVGRDPRLDLALLAIEAPRLPPLPLGRSDDLRVGDWLVALGDAFGDEVTASVGIVSATGRELAGSLVPARALGPRGLLATDARIHRGNSGGPVVDLAGHVVAVAVAATDRPGELAFELPEGHPNFGQRIAALRYTSGVSPYVPSRRSSPGRIRWLAMPYKITPRK